MRYTIFPRHPFLRIMTGLAAAFVAGAALIGVFRLRAVHYLLVLHFDAYRGINAFGTTADVYGILGLAAIIFFLNYVLMLALERRLSVLAHVLVAGTLLVEILLFVAVMVILVFNQI